jgi:hypothetical protein
VTVSDTAPVRAVIELVACVSKKTRLNTECILATATMEFLGRGDHDFNCCRLDEYREERSWS